MRRSAIVMLALFATGAAVLVARGRGVARASAPVLLEVGTSHYGKTYPEWATTWLRWVHETPQPVDRCVLPDEDATGEHCGFGQPSGDVFFLTGTRGSKVIRTQCVVPKGRAIFFPIVVFEQDNAGIPLAEQMSEKRSSAAVTNEINKAKSVSATVDGTAIDVTKLRLGATKLSFTLPPEPNFFTCGGSKGVTGKVDGYYDGYWVMLAPLAPGPHEIAFTATIPRATGLSYDIGVVYRLRVE